MEPTLILNLSTDDEKSLIKEPTRNKPSPQQDIAEEATLAYDDADDSETEGRSRGTNNEEAATLVFADLEDDDDDDDDTTVATQAYGMNDDDEEEATPEMDEKPSTSISEMQTALEAVQDEVDGDGGTEVGKVGTGDPKIRKEGIEANNDFTVATQVYGADEESETVRTNLITIIY